MIHLKKYIKKWETCPHPCRIEARELMKITSEHIYPILINGSFMVECYDQWEYDFLIKRMDSYIKTTGGVEE